MINRSIRKISFLFVFLVMLSKVIHIECAATITTGVSPEKIISEDDQKRNILNCLFLMAISNGDISEMQRLLDAGAQINNMDPSSKCTPLITATATGRIESVEMLLARGANFDLADKDGETALMYAAKQGDEKIVRLLIKYGANFDLVNNEGHDALTLAGSNIYPRNSSKNIENIVALLKIKSYGRKKLIEGRQLAFRAHIYSYFPFISLIDRICEYAQESYLDVPIAER